MYKRRIGVQIHPEFVIIKINWLNKLKFVSTNLKSTKKKFKKNVHQLKQIDGQTQRVILVFTNFSKNNQKRISF